jgi:hypothetical protein
MQIISRRTHQPIKLIIFSQLCPDSPFHDWFYQFNWKGIIFNSSERSYTKDDAIQEAWNHIGRLEQPHTLQEFCQQTINFVRGFCGPGQKLNDIKNALIAAAVAAGFIWLIYVQHCEQEYNRTHPDTEEVQPDNN